MIFQGSNSVLQEHGTVIDQLQDPGRSSRIGGRRCASPVVAGCTVQLHGGAGRARRSNGDAWHRRARKERRKKKTLMASSRQSRQAAGQAAKLRPGTACMPHSAIQWRHERGEARAPGDAAGAGHTGTWRDHIRTGHARVSSGSSAFPDSSPPRLQAKCGHG